MLPRRQGEKSTRRVFAVAPGVCPWRAVSALCRRRGQPLPQALPQLPQLRCVHLHNTLGHRPRLHPGKTKIVSCTDADRRGQSPNEQVDFLGYPLRPRRSKNRWEKYCVNFSPGIRNTAAKAIRQTIRGRRLDGRIDKQVDDLARMFNPIIRGWMTYYGQ
jgi:Group II intron, maturase-specific domain